MRNKIIITLHSTDLSQARWVRLDENNRILQEKTGNLSEMNAATQDNEIIVIVPAQDVLLAHVKLPKLRSQRLKQALPYALEEQLVSDITELHFAPGTQQLDGTYPVAIVAKQKMAAWLSTLAEAGIRPTALISEIFTLPLSADSWQVLVHDAIAVVRTHTYEGFACDQANMAEMLALKLAEDPKKPQRITLYQNSAQPLTFNHRAAVVNKQTLTTQQWVDELCLALGKTAFINLLQYEYTPKRPSTSMNKMGKIIACLAAAIVAVGLMNNIVSFFILHHQVNHLNQAIYSIYHRHFPDAKNSVAPKERMLAKLKSLDQQASQNRFLLWLGYVAKAMAAANQVHINRLDFHANQMTLELSAPEAHTLDLFVQALNQYGLHVKQENIIPQGAQINTSLLITES